MTEVKTITVADPLTFDGTPYEAAGRACAQAAAVAEIALDLTKQAQVMARNAQLSRNLLETPEDARASEWPESAQARSFDKAAEAAEEVVARLETLTRAASFDPKHPPRA